MRPIVSFYRSYSYNCGKFLARKTESILENKYRIKDSFGFVNQITKLNSYQELLMATFDVNGLYSSIIVNEVIQKISDDISKYIHLDKNILEKLFKLCLIKPSFKFDQKYFVQKDGVAMGSPLSPAFSEYLMQKLETDFVPQI